MKYLKKRQYIVFLLSIILSFALLLSSCGSNQSGSAGQPESGTMETSKIPEISETSGTPETSGTSETSESSEASGAPETSESSETSGTPETSVTSESPETVQKVEGTQAEASLLPHRYAGKSEAKKLLLSNHSYYDGFSQNDLDFRMGSKDASMAQYKKFAKKQMQDFTDQEIMLLDGIFAEMENKLTTENYKLPPIEEIIMIKTTALEECRASGYTRGSQIYLRGDYIERSLQGDEKAQEWLESTIWHELFHCLTRNNPDFRREMYKIIHFTVVDKDYEIPPSVFEYHISNPDVEHHNSYASFIINGETIDCFTDYVTTRHFEKAGDDFFKCTTTALVPVDGSDVYYTPEEAQNFDQIFGKNTKYVVDPEECMADNFAYALYYGRKGPEGTGYPNPEIIEAILHYISNN